MSKERKTRNFDFLKEPLPELPSREEVIQKTVALTGQTVLLPETVPSVIAPPAVAENVESVEIKVKPEKKAATKPKVKPQPEAKAAKVQAVISVEKEKLKVGRKALEDARKPFTSTITVDNKRQLRKLCAEYDIAMSDALNEILAAQFEKRPPKYQV